MVLLNGLFGALRDAGPDYWGRRVIERHAGKAQLGELDYLLVDAVCREPLALPLCRTGGTHAAERSGYSVGIGRDNREWPTTCGALMFGAA